ncbi:MAG TPA: SDR family oxidoreductase [Bacteroidota bacterium]|nr:SDR family oxidoreductase [Bacteroidota bacterium]
MNLRNKVGLITGGGSGIGYAVARALARDGVQTILASRRVDLLREKAGEISASTQTRSYAVAMDVRSRKSIEAALGEVSKVFPTIDILINNSGVGADANAVDLREEDWDRVLETNLKGAFLLTRAVLPGMITRRSGQIVNIASQAAIHGYARATAYCASKFGLVGFGKALQEEVREYNIRVTNILPALVQVPPPAHDRENRKGVLQVEDLAETVLFALRQPDRVKIDDLGLFHI